MLNNNTSFIIFLLIAKIEICYCKLRSELWRSSRPYACLHSGCQTVVQKVCDQPPNSSQAFEQEEGHWAAALSHEPWPDAIEGCKEKTPVVKYDPWQEAGQAQPNGRP